MADTTAGADAAPSIDASADASTERNGACSDARTDPDTATTTAWGQHGAFQEGPEGDPQA